MFKIHYIGDRHCPLVEWSPFASREDSRVFNAWVRGKGLFIHNGGVILLEEEDLKSFLDFAVREEFESLESNQSWESTPLRVVPIESDLLRPVTVLGFVSKNPNCTFTQIKNATGLRPGELGKALDGFVEEGTIKREKKGSQFFYST